MKSVARYETDIVEGDALAQVRVHVLAELLLADDGVGAEALPDGCEQAIVRAFAKAFRALREQPEADEVSA